MIMINLFNRMDYVTTLPKSMHSNSQKFSFRYPETFCTEGNQNMTENNQCHSKFQVEPISVGTNQLESIIIQ